MKKLFTIFGVVALMGAGCAGASGLAQTSFDLAVEVPENWTVEEDGGTQVRFTAEEDIVVVMDVNETTDRPIEGAETPIAADSGARVYIRSCGSDLPCYLVDVDGEFYKVWWSVEGQNGAPVNEETTQATLEQIAKIMLTVK